MSVRGLGIAAAAFAVATIVPVFARAQECIGDCDGNRHVSTAELITGINQCFGEATPPCGAFDANQDGRVTIDEVVAGVDGAVNGCPRRTGTFTLTLMSGGRERQALVTVPESLDPETPAPLVLNYHGVIATSAIIQANTRMPEKAMAEGFITAAPQGIGRSWNAGLCCGMARAQRVDDVGLTRDLIAALQSEFAIDPARIYATGLSNGSAMVFRLACEMADVFAAVAPVAGSLALPNCQPAEGLPMLIINNLMDPVVDFSLATTSFDIWRDLNSCTGDAIVTQPAETTECQTYSCPAGPTALCAVSGTSHVWPGGESNADGLFDATDAVWDFFRAHPRPTP